MTRRIVVAIVVVTGLSVVAFAVPLALIIGRLYREQAVVRLEREATAATIEVPADFRDHPDQVDLPHRPGGDAYALYLPNGRRLVGAGPESGDRVVRDATAGEVSEQQSSKLVVAVPVFSHEDVIAVMRASSAMGPVRRKILIAWGAMALLGALIIGAAAALAFALARRLNQPVEALADAATLLGEGDFAARAQRSGIDELDDAVDALNSTAARLGALMERERAFSADASHQLRTPLTGLRMNLEELARSQSDPDVRLGRALQDVERLDRTIIDLLALARDEPSVRSPIDLVAVLLEVDRAWRTTVEAQGRRLVLRRAEEVPPVRASSAALHQILDVLLSNAVQHGMGTVTLAAREVAGATAVDVIDEGEVAVPDPEQLFVRRAGDRPGHGIGLALARTLAEAEGGRLLLRDRGPGATFTLLFPSAGEA